MKRVIRILVILFVAVNLWSLIPLVGLYFKPQAPPYPSNEQICLELANNTGDRFKFIVFGDPHNGFFMCDSATLKLISWMNNEGRYSWTDSSGKKHYKTPLDFVINTGDATFRGKENSYKRYAKIRNMIKWPVLTAIGNHDKDVSEHELFKKYCGKGEFAFADRNSYFVFLDNAESHISDEQFDWLENKLKEGLKYDHRFIIMHKSPVDPLQRHWYRPERDPWHRRFMDICWDYDVAMVFTGHTHMFASHNFNDVEYITTGASGMPIEVAYSDGGYLHYVVVKVNGPYIDYEVRKIAPPIWEIFTYYMWKDLIYYIRGLFWYW
jgi:predicted phosphodiesterase